MEGKDLMRLEKEVVSEKDFNKNKTIKIRFCKEEKLNAGNGIIYGSIYLF